MRRLGAIVLVLLLAGCTRIPLDEVPAASTPQVEPAPAGNTPAAPSPLPATPRLDVTLEVEDRWVRPEDTVRANATARASSYEWYLAPRNPLWTLADPGPFAIASGGTQTLDVRRAGRHVFALDDTGARLGVSIREDALPLRLDARVIHEGNGTRFSPDELVGGPGSVVRLTHTLPDTVTLRRVESMMPIASQGSTVTFAMPDLAEELGDYDLVVLARDGAGALGEASARIIYDNRKPDTQRTFGPYDGSFPITPLPTDDAPHRHTWTNAHPLRSLDVTITLTSDTPAPSAVRVSLQGPDGTTIGSTETDTFTADALPPGEYAFLIEHLGGALVHYSITARGEWHLEPPTSFFPGDE